MNSLTKLSLKRPFNFLLGSDGSLSKKAVRGGFWVFALSAIARALGLLRTVILARVLSPDDFGLMGVALLSMSALETFSQTGFSQALVQKQEDTDEYLDTAWTIQVIRGFVLASILFLGAPLVGQFFGEPAATMLVRVLGLSELLKGLTNIGVVYFSKQLDFQKQFIYQISGILADLAVAIPIALVLRSVWALAFGLLAGNLVRCVASYIIDPYRPRLQFNEGQVRELFGFGKWILGSSILVFLITQGDDVFVGKLLGTTMLGFYQMAYKISNMPATEITHVISQVTFPAYSKLQDNISKLGEAYLKVLQLTAFLSFPIAGLIFALAPDFTQIFLGEKWMPMVPAMQVLVLAGLVRSIAATTGPIFQAVGRPKIDTRWQVVRLFAIALPIYPCITRWGIFGVSIVVFLSMFVSNIGFSFSAVRIVKCGFKNFGKVVVFPLISGTALVLSIFALKTHIDTAGILNFILLASVGTLIYFIMIYIFDKHLDYNVRQFLR